MKPRRGATVVGLAVSAVTASAFVEPPRARAQSSESSAQRAPNEPGVPSDTTWALRFVAPVECGDSESFRRRVSELLRSRALHADGLVVAVNIERAATSHYQLALQVQTLAGPAQRQLQADNCDALVRAAAAIVAFSLSDSSTTPNGEERPGAPEVTGGAEAPGTTATATPDAPTSKPSEVARVAEPAPLRQAESSPTEATPPEPARPTEPEGAEPGSTAQRSPGQADRAPNDADPADDDTVTHTEAAAPRTGSETAAPMAVWFLVGPKFDAGLLPSGAVSGRIGAGWGDGVGVQLTISGALASAISSAAQLPQGRRFLRYSLEAQLAYFWPLATRVSAGPLLSLDVALVTAGGAPGQPGATSTAAGGALGGAAEITISRGLRLRPEVELLIAARRAQFDTWEATASDPVWIAPRFGARAGLALMATF